MLIGAALVTGALLLATRTAQAQITTQPPWTDVRIVALQPAEYSVSAVRPGFSGQFGVPVDPSSLQFTLDGRDVSNLAYASTWEFMVTAPADITAGTHIMRVTGKATNGATFDRSWEFVTTTGMSPAQNYLVLSPGHDYFNGSSFVISGTTLPYSHVRIAATPALQPSGVLAAVPGTFAVDAYADSDGNFTVPVYMDQGGIVAVRVLSIDPTADAGASATLYVTD